MDYKLGYDSQTGQIVGVNCEKGFIPICEGNADYQDFLIWNNAQKTPLDLNSTIAVVKPEPDPLIAAKVAWTSATTQVQKLAVIAKVLKLEG